MRTIEKISVVRLFFGFILASLALTPLLYGQTQSGNILGKVVNSSGGVLPGVTVTLTGVAAPHTFVTTEDGDFRFRNLSPGRYTVTAELSGFSTVRRDVDVTIGKNSEIELPLSPAMSESITVSAETPMIDTRNTGTGANIEQEELVNIPTGRDPWVILQSVPGVLVDRVNVGGNESGQQSYFVGKGVERHQTEWNIDGVAITEMAATGTSTFYYDFDSFEEMQVSTGGADPSVRTPGVHLNMVTKRGTNELMGSGRYFWTDKKLQSDAVIPAEAVDYLPAGGNSIDHIDDYGLELGGPIIRDRLWAWGAYSGNSIDNFSNAASVIQRTDLENWNGKVNFQLTQANSGAAFYMWNDKTVFARGISSTRPVETAKNQSGPGDLLKLEDTHMFSQNLYGTLSLAKVESGYKLVPIGGRDVDAWWDVDEGWHRSHSYYEQNTPQENVRVDGSAYVKTGAVTNELKFGFGYRDTPVDSITAWPGSGNFGNFYDGYALAALTRPAVPNFGSRYVDLYVGDTIQMGNLTLTGGLRYDVQRARNFGSTVPANPIVPDLLPEATYAGDTETLEWKGISPRLGATWAIGSEKKTVLRGSYNRYMDQLGSSDAGSSNPFYLVQYLYYYWEDLNQDKVVQRNEIDFDAGLYSFFNIDPDNPAAGYAPGRLDYGQDPTSTDELVLGVEHELAPAFSVGLSYSHRKRDNFLWDRFEKTRGANDFYTSDDYVLTTPMVGTRPDGSSYSVPVYRLKPGLAAPTNYVTTNRPDYHQTYDGVELVATKRMTNRWMMRGNLTLSDWKQHVGPKGYVDPTMIVSGDSCTSCDGAIVASSGGIGGQINSRWAYSVNGAYELPLGFMLGAAVVGREGYVLPYFRRVNSRDGQGNRNVMVSEEFGSNRLPDLFNLDLRVAWDFTMFGDAALNLAIDLFNVTNERTILDRDNRVYAADGTTGLTNRISQLQSPRVWRFGARVRF